MHDYAYSPSSATFLPKEFHLQVPGAVEGSALGQNLGAGIPSCTCPVSKWQYLKAGWAADLCQIVFTIVVVIRLFMWECVSGSRSVPVCENN